MELTASFLALLQDFQCVFTPPTLVTFVALLSGWCLSHRHRFVTELIQSSGSTHRGHHSRYHRFFSQARWSLDALCLVLACVLVRVFAPVTGGKGRKCVSTKRCRFRPCEFRGRQ